MAEQRWNPWKVGCIIALLAGGGILLLCGGLLTLAVWALSQNPQFQQGMAIATGAFEIQRDAATGPGAEAMRRAGCGQAFAYTPEMLRRFASLVPRDEGEKDPPEPTMPVLNCLERATPVQCPEVVQAYLQAVQPKPEEVAIRIQRRNGTVVCEGRFSRAGERLGPIDSAAMLPPGTVEMRLDEPPPEPPAAQSAEPPADKPTASPTASPLGRPQPGPETL